MKNIISIYKFNFPFLLNSFEEAKYSAIISDLHHLLLYNEVLLDIKKTTQDKYESIEFEIKNASVKTIYYSNNDVYFLPKFQLELFVENNIDENIIRDIFKIFETVGLKEYIFEIDWYENISKNHSLITPNILEQYFSQYSETQLENFLKNTDKKYIDEGIKENEIIRNSFYYLIYICYLFFRNIHDSDKNIQEINSSLWEKIPDIYKWSLALWKQRLKHINNLNSLHFKKYKYMLDRLFSILK